MSVLFVSGIDTEVGKTYATGWLAKSLRDKGVKAITQKMVQTGNVGISYDIQTHRQLMGIPLQAEDRDHTTCAYLYQKPASPHLAAALESRPIKPVVITQATNRLLQTYPVVLLEGAGGLLVPINDTLLMLDYVAEQGYPVVLVTTGRLGSINHTLLSLEAISARGLVLHTLLYNHCHDHIDPQIAANTRNFLYDFKRTHYPNSHWLQLPKLTAPNEVSQSSTTHQQTDGFDLADTYLSLPC